MDWQNHGCLVSILFVCVLIGNPLLLFIFFSEELRSNPAAWLIVIVAVIADCILLSEYFSNAAVKKKEKEKQEFQDYKNKYELKPIQMATVSEQKSTDDVTHISEIGRQYNRLCSLNTELINEINGIAKSQSAIFSSCVLYGGEFDLRSLRSKENLLQENSNHYTEKYRTLINRKVKIMPAENNEIFANLQRCLSLLESSYSLSNDLDFKSFYHFSGQVPFFEFNEMPIVINMDKFSYFITPNVILKTHNNQFVAAYSPAVMQVEIETLTEPKFHYPQHEAIEEDTEIIQVDAKRYSWLHTRMDGSPDLRYSYNPQTEYTVKEDYYKFALLHISILNEKKSFYISSFTKAEQFKNAAEKYAETLATCDFARDLVLLLDECDDNNDARTMVELLSKKPDKNKICEIVGV